jgi:hypothetical protein
MYGFPSTVEMEKNKRECLWVALELFYVYGPPNFETTLDHIEQGCQSGHLWDI